MEIEELILSTAQISGMFAGLQFAFYALAPLLIPKYLPFAEGERSEVIRKIHMNKFIKKFKIDWGFYFSFISFVSFIFSICISLFFLYYDHSSLKDFRLLYVPIGSFFCGLLFFSVSAAIILNSILGEYKILSYTDHVREAITSFGYTCITDRRVRGEISFHFNLKSYSAYINDQQRNLLFLIQDNQDVETMVSIMRSILQEAATYCTEIQSQISLLKKEILEANELKRMFLNKKIEEKSEEQDYYRNPRIVFSRKSPYTKEEIREIEMEKDTICQETALEVFLYIWDEPDLVKEILDFF